jgi:uncharacterized protein involved in exopolysaccharide biosynthesis
MELQNLTDQESNATRSHSLRDLATVLFRHNRLMALAFVGVLTGAVVVATLQDNQYKSHMKILVKRERVDPVVTAQSSTIPQFSTPVSEEELNSEVELLTSSDVLEKVVVGSDLQKSNGFWTKLFSSRKKSSAAQTTEEQVKIAEAVAKLAKDLKIAVVKRTDLISVDYQSSDARLSARVLNNLANSYLEKHVEVHRPPAALDFFQQEAKRYQSGLAEAEARLVDSTKDGAISAQQQKDAALQKLAEFEATARQTQEAIAETQQRIRTLEGQATSTPARMVTQVKDSDDSVLLSGLRSNLLTLELKRTELLEKFEPSYRSVQEVDAQIAQTRTALEAAEKSKLHDETTDQDPTFAWVRGELAKAKTDLAGYQAKSAAAAQAVAAYRETARQLAQKEVEQSDLMRNVKTGEENYMLYLQKEEEARISEALDRRRIINVAIAEPPMVPSLPTNPRYLTVAMGGIFALFFSVGLAFVAEKVDSTFRSPDEVRSVLDIPVFASLPLNGHNLTNGHNGFNGHNGNNGRNGHKDGTFNPEKTPTSETYSS